MTTYDISDLVELRRMIVKKQYLDRLTEEKRRERDSISATLLDLSKIYDKQQEDVIDLEKLSFSNLYYTVLGQRKKMLEKERREVLEAKLKYDTCLEELNALKREIDSICEERLPLEGCEERYEKLLLEKQELILKKDSPLSRELSLLLEKAAKLEKDKKELSEAMDACDSVISISDEICDCFREALMYAKQDLYRDRGTVDYQKHQYINRAESLVVSLGIRMGRLRTELCDVSIDWDTKININSITLFCDLWIDNVFINLSVKKKIEKALRDARKVNSDLVAAKAKLSSVFSRVDSELRRTDSVIKATVTKAEI